MPDEQSRLGKPAEGYVYDDADDDDDNADDVSNDDDVDNDGGDGHNGDGDCDDADEDGVDDDDDDDEVGLRVASGEEGKETRDFHLAENPHSSHFVTSMVRIMMIMIRMIRMVMTVTMMRREIPITMQMLTITQMMMEEEEKVGPNIILNSSSMKSGLNEVAHWSL